MTMQKWVLGNWKMNGRVAANQALLSQLSQIQANEQVAVGVAVPSVYISSALQAAPVLNQTVLVAYEPVWAIGTGVVASIEQIAQMHAFIQLHVLSLLNNGATIRLLYGGSVNADNCEAIFAVKHVDGALVGGASLKFDGFAQIITAAVSAAN